jgi:hypothetical protein
MKKVLTDQDLQKMKKVAGEHNKYVDNTYSFYLSYNLRITFMVIVVLVLCALSFFCFKYSFSNESKRTLLVDKEAKVNTEVKVLDKETFTYDGNNAYLSDVIDDLNMKMEYVFWGTLNGDYYYDYSVDAIMILKDTTGKTIVPEYTETLVSNRTVKNDSLNNIKKLVVKDTLDLDYDSFNRKALSVKNAYNIDLVGVVILEYKINVYGAFEGFDNAVKDTQIVRVRVPLLSNNVEAKIVDTELEKAKYTNIDKPLLTNVYLLYLGIVLLIVAVILSLLIGLFIYNSRPRKSKYCTLRDGILRDYGSIIVNSKRVPQIEKYNIVDCYSFSELLDAQRLVDKPIVYYEIVKNQKCLFFVIGENDIYKFTLKECDIDY